MHLKERRRLERFDLALPASVEVVKSGTGTSSLSLETQNVCSGGAYFTTPQSLPEGTEIRIRLVLPLEKLHQLKETSHARIQVTGKVLRTESSGMSVVFNSDYQIHPYNRETDPETIHPAERIHPAPDDGSFKIDKGEYR
jgi:hypothetical protein